MTILEMKHVSKAFGGSKALSDIHFSVEEGEIHALLGENGAGKSTLMNILTGVIPADTGEISFLGKSYPSPTIRQMEEAGIAFVHQELNVINDLTVADNIFLCRELTGKLGLLRRKEQVARTKELFEDLGVDIDPNACLMEQGILCLGPATMGGCGARCTRVGQPCRGCYGPSPDVQEQGASIFTAVASLFPILDEDPTCGEDEIIRIMSSIKDPLGYFYAYTLGKSLIKRAVVEKGGN